MLAQKHLRFALLSVLLFAASRCFAQPSSGPNSCSSQDSSAAQSSQPAANSRDVSRDSAKDSQKDSAKNSSAPKKRAKKVWTNDDMPSSGGISVIGHSAPPPSSSKAADSPSSSASPREKQIAGYREQLTQLRAELAAADRKISELRGFKGENTVSTGGFNPYHAYSMNPTEDQIKQLEDKKKQLQSQMDDIEEQARKAGIATGDLR